MKKVLTERQELILEFIKQFKEESGYPPTLREIGKNFGISSTFGVKRHLDALVKKGYLKIESNASRGISFQKEENIETGTQVVFERNELFNKIPVVGRVAAGMPILAIENIEGSIVIDSSFMKKSRDCFALKVKGDSMINAGIFEGDLVIVAPQSNAINGEIVVALLDDEATIKTYEKIGNTIRLIPENDNYSPIVIDNTKSFSIAGKIIGVLRWFN